MVNIKSQPCKICIKNIFPGKYKRKRGNFLMRTRFSKYKSISKSVERAAKLKDLEIAKELEVNKLSYNDEQAMNKENKRILKK